MKLVEGKAKKWGSSLGIVIPKDIAEKEKIKDGKKIRFFIGGPVDKERSKQLKRDWEKLGKEITKKWKGPSAVEEVRNQRTKKW